MKPLLDWSIYKDAGMGDAYAGIPKSGGDFAKAVSVCINSRKCETTARGVMCPSYRVTGEPDLSTGGRVRLLKDALSRQDDGAALGDEHLSRAMDLCLGCKGCKRECENEVDMAMIKVEYLAQRHGRLGIPLRTRLLGSLSRHLHRLGWLRHTVVLRNRNPFLARLGELMLGISAKRQLPEPVKTPFTRARDKREDVRQTQHRDTPVGEVVLLIDTFTNNFAPAQAEAAISVLEQAGYRVLPVQASESQRPLCCGRTHIAHGLLAEARHEAGRMLSALLPHVEAGRSIIGLEPACLLAIRDDYRFLGLGEAAEKVARRAILFEEFIAREISAARFKLVLKPVETHGQPLLVHGHCHQKAVGAMKSMRKVLKLIPELQFKLIESSCCGMAGSFGIEKEHADMALQMAEQSLLPALREHTQARILANGFSCRHQIKQGCARLALHLATLLEESMA